MPNYCFRSQLCAFLKEARAVRRETPQKKLLLLIYQKNEGVATAHAVKINIENGPKKEFNPVGSQALA